MTVDWRVSNVPPSTYREGTDSTDSTDSAGISLSEKDRVSQAKYLSS